MSREDDRAKLRARRARDGLIPEAGFIDRNPATIVGKMTGGYRPKYSRHVLRGRMVHQTAERWWDR